MLLFLAAEFELFFQEHLLEMRFLRIRVRWFAVALMYV